MKDRIDLLRFFPYIIVLLGPFILFGPILIQGHGMYWGTIALQFTPWRAYAWQQLQAGTIPLWNNLSGMGTPLMANYQSAFFYPPNWLILFGAWTAGVNGIGWVETLLVMLHIIWAGWGMIYLTKKMGISPFGQTISGVSFSLSGYIIARSSFLSINAAVSWLPWVMALVYLSSSGLAEPKSKKTIFSYRLWLAVCICMQLLSGHAQTTWYTCMLAGIFVIFWGWKKRRWVGAATELGWFLLCGLAGVLIAAVQLIPTAEYLIQSQRAGQVNFDYAMNYSYWPWRLITIFIANFFGTPAQGTYWVTADAYWEDAVYIGLIPIILAGRAAVSGLSKKVVSDGNNQSILDRPFVILLTCIGCVSILLALGKYTPIFPFLYRYIPTFNMFQAPSRYMIWFVWVVSLLSGFGADLWIHPFGRAVVRAKRLVVAALAVIIAAGICWIGLRDSIRPTFIQGIGILGVGLFAYAILNLSVPRDRTNQQHTRWYILVIMIILGDLIFADWGLNPGIDLTLLYSGHTGTVQPSSGILGRYYIPPEDESRLKFKKIFKFEDFSNEFDSVALNETLLPNTNLVDAVPSANNFDPLIPARYQKWMDYLSSVDVAQRNIMLRWMDVGAVEYVNTQPPYDTNIENIPGGNKISWTDCVINTQGEKDTWQKTTQLIQDNASRQDAHPNTITAETTTQYSCQNEPNLVKMTPIVDQPQELEVSVESKGKGVLVISQVLYPGWKAEIDSKDANLFFVNYLTTGLEVPAGSHIIKVTYDPNSFKIGWIVSLVSFLLLMGVFIYIKNKR